MTAVEWLVNRFGLAFQMGWEEEIQQAKKMEKEQIEDAFNAGVSSEDYFCPPFELSESDYYYNETFKKDKS